MKIAHKYQVTTCVEFCSEFLRGILKADNACYLLEHARLLEDKGLVRAATDFTDDNAPAVTASEGFKDIRPETLEYFLKGNTFFAPEVDIVKAVDEWASNYLSKNKMTVDSESKRLVMGKAFYWLRLPTLGLHDFFAAQMKYEYLTNEEQLNIIRYIVLKETHDIDNSLEQRRPRKATYIRSVLECQEPKDITPNETLTNVFTLTCTHNIELEKILLLQRQDQLTGTIVETSFDEVVSLTHKVTLKRSLHRDIKLEPPVQLKASINPYKIKVTITKVDNFERASRMSAQPLKAMPVQKSGFGGFGFSMSQAAVRESVSVQTESDPVLCNSWMVGPSSVSLECRDWQSCFIRGIKYTNLSYRDQR